MQVIAENLKIVRAAMSLLPNWLPGKYRLASIILRCFNQSGLSIIAGKTAVYATPSLLEPISVNIVAFGEYEPETIRLISAELPRGGLFVDVGANIGAISIPVALARPDVRVVAIEASPRVFPVLKGNIERNGVNNIQAVNAFAADRDLAEIDFYESPDRKFGMGSAGAQFHSHPVPVRCSTVRSILAKHNFSAPDVIKIDVEGAEVMALRGIRDELESGSWNPVIIFECDGGYEGRIPSQSAGDSQRFLMHLGYELRFLPPFETKVSAPLTTQQVNLVGRRIRPKETND